MFLLLKKYKAGKNNCPSGKNEFSRVGKVNYGYLFNCKSVRAGFIAVKVRSKIIFYKT
jgi:hypothetical protein